MVNEISQHFAYRRNIKFQLLAIGIWPNEHPSLFYRFIPCICLILSFCTTCGIFGYVKAHITNVTLATRGFCVMVGHLTGTLKITWVMIHRDGVKELYNILDTHFTKLLNGPMSKLVSKGATTFHYLSWLLTFLLGFNGSSYIAIPVISIIYQHLRHVQPIRYMRVYPTVYPWALNPPGYRYIISFAMESTATMGTVCVTAGVDSLFTIYGFQMIAQFREMSHRITNISNELNKNNVLRECVAQHQKILKCRDLMQEVFGPIILWVMATNSIILCSLIFQLSQASTLGTVIFFAAYTSMKTVQTFMYAWTGASLTQASDDFTHAVYDSDWFGNKQFMTSVLIILAQRPLILTACNFSNVSLDMFVMIINTTMSYFFLLRTMDSN